ncbi:MAG: hypothetical protein R8P61_34530 [Bacteroidia bacterium]|nr:hypothetical protein [Bacteroidia bacterium]
MLRLVPILFVLFGAILTALIAMSLTRFFVESSGLAGSASVLIWGILGLIGGGIGSFILKNRLSQSQLNMSTLVFGLAISAFIFWIYIRIQQNKTTEPIPPLPPTEVPNTEDERV